jgi:hypothetical protein
MKAPCVARHHLVRNPTFEVECDDGGIRWVQNYKLDDFRRLCRKKKVSFPVEVEADGRFCRVTDSRLR